MNCPSCGGAKLVRDTRDMPYTRRGASILIPRVTGDFCSVYGEVVLDGKQSGHVSGAMLDFNRQVKA